MSWLAGPYLAAAVLLVVAGAPKLRRPEPAVRALASSRLPASASAVRGLGAVEAAIGVSAVTVGGRVPAALVAASYVAFTAFVALALRRGGVLASCGCFGRADTPPTRSHLAVTGVFAAIALAGIARPLPALPAMLDGAPMDGLTFLALTAVACWLTYLVLAVLPRTSGRAVARSLGAPSRTAGRLTADSLAVRRT